MSKLVIELQKACLNERISVAELLRKAHFIAQKLNIKEMVDYCVKELEGYHNENVPDYRKISVEYKVHVLNKWVPIGITKPMDSILIRSVNLSVGEMERFLRQEATEMFMSVPEEQQNQICKWCGLQQNFEVRSFYPKNLFIRIIDTVRNRISEWSVALEKEGILGEEFEFTEEEQENAKHMTIININGSVSGSNVVGHMEHSSVTINNNNFDFEALKKLIAKIEADLENAKNIEAEKTDSLKEQITLLKKSVEEKNETSTIDLLKQLAVGAASSGIWSIGSTITTFLASMA